MSNMQNIESNPDNTTSQEKSITSNATDGVVSAGTDREPIPASDEPIICAIDHGYANIKTPTMCFPANVLPCEEISVFTHDLLTFEGKDYIIGIGHKEFRADKIMDEDYYILTLATIAKELRKKNLTEAKIILAVGLPLTWVDEQGERFKEYLLKNKTVD